MSGFTWLFNSFIICWHYHITLMTKTSIKKKSFQQGSFSRNGKSTSARTNVSCQSIMDQLDSPLEKYNRDISLACLIVDEDINSDKMAPNCPLPYEVVRPGNLRRGHAATAIKNDIKTVSGLHNSGLIMFDTAASLSSAFKERAQIQDTLCRGRGCF